MGAKAMIGRRIDRAVKRANLTAARKRARDESAQRGRERQFLALAMGQRMLNDLERVGCFCISDYLKIRPKSVINAWVNTFADTRRRK